ncbi:MAG: 4Fe-4S binding protein [Elusimicrobiota bacterium]
MKKKWVRSRVLSQLLFLLLFSYLISHPLRAARLFFAVDPLIALTVSLAGRVFIKTIIISLVFVVLTALAGRFFCGWICPMGTFIDAFGYIRRKVSRKRVKDISPRRLSCIKYVIFIIVIILAVFGIQLLWMIDPMSVSGRFISTNLLPAAGKAVENSFRFVIQRLGFPDIFMNMYRWLLGIAGGTLQRSFNNGGVSLAIFSSVILTGILGKRFWCRNLCPLGALYALLARFSFLERKLDDSCNACQVCVLDCRMGALEKENVIRKEECILCMDCIDNCTTSSARFLFKKKLLAPKSINSSRRDFLKYAGITSIAVFTGWRNRQRWGGGRGIGRGMEGVEPGIIRPPGVIDEPAFQKRCIRCGNCMNVCPTNGLQPVLLKAGPAGVWTPELVPEIGACEYNCAACGVVCPTGAIPELGLEIKRLTRLGRARVNRSICLPWKGETSCIVCEEQCPVEEKAIKLIEEDVNGTVFQKPVVDKGLCIGCGKCQNACPARPERAIKVYPLQHRNRSA